MHDTTAAIGKPGQGHVPSLTILVPVTSSIETWRNARYVTTPPDVSDVANSQLTMFDVDRVFRTDRPPRALRDLTQHGWKTARLTELAQHICYVPSAKAADRPAILSSASGEPALILPIEPHLDAVTGDPAEVAPDNRILVVQTRDKHADADYLAGWLNSPLGRKLRSAAASSGSDSYVSPRGFNLTQAWRMADDLLIALPDLSVQRDMARTERALGAARRHLVDSRRELWNDPRKRSDIYREASRLIPSADLAQWAATLPFPMASACGPTNPKVTATSMPATLRCSTSGTPLFSSTPLSSCQAFSKTVQASSRNSPPSLRSSVKWGFPPKGPASVSGILCCNASPRGTAPR